MTASVKFCGLTRAVDARLGASLGASFLGVVFAESRRRLDAVRALAVFAPLDELRDPPKRVGVFDAASSLEILATAAQVGLDVIQLHADPKPSDVRSLRGSFGGEIWAARRIEGDQLPEDLDEIASAADRVLLDARLENGSPLGGGGRTFAWEAVVSQLKHRSIPRLVLAGGLTPENVGLAIELFAPSVVDVSSGVEQSVGVKDEALMRAFVRAVGAGAMSR
ncbi:MAG TPA: phosphoribosylanthranilate isomerase [Gemmatimonadaceae bacterium]|nr:phosphoribosylanthranilate isomerase [Gemmatimonadaceae bacterium]